MNSITLIGNICNDLELKQTQSGKSVLTFNLAVNRPYVKDVTDFIPIVIWSQTAEYLVKYAKKGTKVAVLGKLTTRTYEDKNGTKHNAFDVVADSVEICEPARTNATETKSTHSASNAPYIPDAYKTPQFEELHNNEGLPF